jgi:hypothetical protein
MIKDNIRIILTFKNHTEPYRLIRDCRQTLETVDIHDRATKQSLP